MKKLNLSEQTVNRLPMSKHGRVVIHDAKERGLLLVIGKYRKSWVFRDRTNYKTLGIYPTLGTEQARQTVRLLRVQNALSTKVIQEALAKLGEAFTLCNSVKLASGLSEDEQINSVNQCQKVPTLATALSDYISNRGLKENTSKDMTRRIRSVADGLYYERPITELTSDVFGSWYQKTSATKPAQASATGRYLRALIKWASVAYDLPHLVEPTSKIRIMTGSGFGTNIRDNRLTKATLLPWWRIVSNAEKIGRVALMTYLMTGIRRSELTSLSFANVSQSLIGGADRVTLTLEDTKNGKNHVVYLGARMSNIWHEYLPNVNPCEPLFKESNVRKVTELLNRGLNIQTVTVHDLRRSFASFAHEAGCDSVVIKAMLNHTPGTNDVTARHYVRASADVVAAGWQKVENYLFGLIEGVSHD